MKRLQIEVRFNDDNSKIATAIKDEGFSKNITGQLEILGIIENIKGIIQDKIKKFLDVSK